jgi:hypothetical protein
MGICTRKQRLLRVEACDGKWQEASCRIKERLAALNRQTHDNLLFAPPEVSWQLSSYAPGDNTLHWRTIRRLDDSSSLQRANMTMSVETGEHVALFMRVVVDSM